MNSTPVQALLGAALSAAIRQKAKDLGFDLVGIASAEPSRHRDYLRQWLAAGNAGSMDYLTRRFDERTDVGAYLPGAASVICVALNYHAPLASASEEGGVVLGRIARYALGDDYHEIMKPRLHAIADFIRGVAPEAQTKCSVDTAPILERELAARAGLGWVGKNTCVIHPEFGSWLLLGEIITTIALPADEPMADHCGTCTRCIDACPTHAISSPYQLDASRCISYLTIEHRAEIPKELHQPIGDWLYGCDVCQDVCPHNHRAKTTSEPSLAPRFETGTLDVSDVLQWDDEQYRSHLRGSAIKRVKLPVLQRNALIVQENRKSQDCTAG